jgi:transposase
MFAFRRKRPKSLEDAENGLTERFRALLHGLWDDLLTLDQRIETLNGEIECIAKNDPVAQRLQQLRGVASAKHKDYHLSRWVTELSERSHPNVAAVALANKTVRIAWAMMNHDADYDPEFAVS